VYRIAARRSRSIHARIIWQDGQFCLEDVSGTTFAVNEAGHSIGAQCDCAVRWGPDQMGSITFMTQIIIGSEKVDIADYQHPQSLITMSNRSDVNQIH
jgi:type VI secretion system protein ImpI